MGRKPRRTFSTEDKRKAVDDYLDGVRTAAEIAHDMQIATGQIYKWKAEFEKSAKDSRVSELEGEGMTRAMALKIQQQEMEIEAYQKKVAEQALMIDLLKKLQNLPPSQRESELSGLLETIKRADRKRKLVK